MAILGDRSILLSPQRQTRHAPIMSRAQSLSPSVSHHYPIFIWGIYLLTSSKQHLKQSRCALAISGNGIWHPSVTQIGSRWCLMRQLAVAWRSVEYVLSIDCVISWGKFHFKNKYVNICVYIYVCVWLCVYVCIILTCCILSTHMRIYTYMCTKCGCLCVCQFPPNNVQASLKWSCVPVSLVRGHMDLRLRPCGCEGHHVMLEV